MINISRRLVLLTGAALLLLFLLGVGGVISQNKALEDARHQRISTLLHMSAHLLDHFHDMETRGALSREQAQAQAKAALTQLNNGSQAYVFARTPGGNTLVHIDPKKVNSTVNAKLPDGRSDTQAYQEAMAASADGVGFVHLLVPKVGEKNLVGKLNGVMAYPAWDWWLGTGMFDADTDAEFYRSIWLSGAMLCVAVVLLGVFAWQTIRGVLTALGGELSVACQVAHRIASGDLSKAVPLKTGDDQSMMAQLAHMQEQLRNIVHGIRHGADSINTGAAEIATGTMNLSQRTEQQAAALQETAASIEQMVETVRHNSENSTQAHALADGAAELANKGSEVVAEMVETMTGIHGSSQRIRDIVGVIDGIAFQTNILALNAAVEAARAGEEGRGFAVVAGEVRTLAQRSATAAKEIAQLISESTEKVETGVALAGKAGSTVQDMRKAVADVSTLVREVSNATNDQTSQLDQISTAIARLDQNTQQNAALCEESAAASQSLSMQANNLQQSASVFQLAA
jgi:methyl-accepting chemotaxis protein